ncbi:hypothetical protein HY933_02735 [Candidatus Falkowbacteria bacterium]|nr:hypothetical protein [Candidatus Falkowbacteria bacterium]
MDKRLFIAKILSDVVAVSLASEVVFVLAELAKPGFVTNYLNLNLFLLWCVFVASIYVLIRD